jgi:hypothetical protein
MLAGTALAVLVGYLMPSSLKLDESAVFAVLGMMVGWSTAWLFARSIQVAPSVCIAANDVNEPVSSASHARALRIDRAIPDSWNWSDFRLSYAVLACRAGT